MKTYFIFFVAAIILTLLGCKKFLDDKPNATLEVPTTLTDFQALLDRYRIVNNSDPASGEISADNYYLATADYLALTGDQIRNIYTWQKGNLFVPQTNDWYNCYSPVFICNTALAGLQNIQATPENQAQYNNVKGQSYFDRGRAFFMVASLWALAYESKSASADLGIPTRLSVDFNDKSVRGTLEQTYSQIISDLTLSASLLPVTQVSPIRPTKAAAFAMLAKTYLNMGNFSNAEKYADSCLQLYNTLLDYNSVDSTKSYPFAKFNVEVIHESLIAVPQVLTPAFARIDTNLYASYSPNDLRKHLFFTIGTNGSPVFRGSYEAGSNLFSGIATDELYLIRAECFARAGDLENALKDLNALMIMRYKKGTFTPFTAASSDAALQLILTERRKELLMRGSRWMDIKRLNVDAANITLERQVNGSVYTLPPNSLRFALPIPDDIIQLSGMQQNPR